MVELLTELFPERRSKSITGAAVSEFNAASNKAALDAVASFKALAKSV